MSELGRSDLNVAFNSRIQQLLQHGLIPAVEKGLQDAWGSEWVRELNERRRGKPDPSKPTHKPKSIDAIPVREGKPVWDTSTLLHTIREYGREMQNCRREQSRNLFTWCKDLLELRNGPAHSNVENYDVVNADRKVGHQAELAIKLLRAFHAEKEAQQIEALMDSVWSSRADDPTKRVELDRPSLEPATAPSTSTKELEAKTSLPIRNRGGSSQSKRRMPLPPPGPGVVVFPLVGQDGALLEDECLGSVAATVIAGESSQVTVHTGYAGDTSAFYQIVNDVRYSEPDSPKITEKTRHRFDPGEFLGNSFGLAVALADRGARYGIAEKHRHRRVVATGAILPKLGGEIGAINGLEEKISIVQCFAPRGTLFIVPRRNLNEANSQIKDALANLNAAGIDWRAVSHIDELNDLLDARLGGSSDDKIPEQPATLFEGVQEPPSSEATSSERPYKAPEIAARRLSPRLFAYAAATGLSLLSIAYMASVWLQPGSQDVAAVQASDERLRALSQSALRASSADAQAVDCTNLIAAASKISTDDVARLEELHRSAMARARACTDLLAQSDRRLHELLSAAKSPDPSNPSGIAQLGQARADLTAFDLSREKTDELRAAIAAGDRAMAEIKASDERIADFKANLETWHRDEANGTNADNVAAAFSRLDAFDLGRPGPTVEQDVQTARRLLTRLSDSDTRINEAIIFVSAMEAEDTLPGRRRAQEKLDLLSDFDASRLTPSQRTTIEQGRSRSMQARWKDFEAAAVAFGSGPTDQNTLRVLETFDALTLQDRATMSSSLRRYREVADAARQRVLESNQRLAKLETDYEKSLEAERRRADRGALFQQLVDTADALTDLDKSRFTEQQEVAAGHADELRLELKASDERIANVQTWSEIALKAKSGQEVPGGLLSNVREARAALTDLDKERMTTEQVRILQEVCGVAVGTKPGVLPALAGSRCFGTEDLRPRQLPAIRY